ncbi:hypothetical protein [Mastigocladopsis repens]|uniref:hypothetical protein n=1 Tax=Mastigocladopsis repens TaxID=221287 RepID=UPI0002EAE6C7|nr:hypothetical protein [Mastigocladopsis repens]
MNRTTISPLCNTQALTSAHLLAVLLASLLSSACDRLSNASPTTNSKEVPSSPPQVVKPTVTGFVATLEDEVKELPKQRIAWSTYWKLCWQPYPGAKAYELQGVTMEGMSSKLKHQSDRCYRLQAARGENPKSDGFVNRDLTLATHSVQLGYRVRAVLDGNRVSEWSSPMPVGEATKPKTSKK